MGWMKPLPPNATREERELWLWMNRHPITVHVGLLVFAGVVGLILSLAIGFAIGEFP
jgi:hypothetical protein